MKLTARQAADILRVSLVTVRRLKTEGKLTDLGTRQDGKSKHYAAYDAKQVRELAKQYRPRNGNRHATPAASGDSAPGMLRRIDDRLARLESAVADLARLWS